MILRCVPLSHTAKESSKRPERTAGVPARNMLALPPCLYF